MMLETPLYEVDRLGKVLNNGSTSPMAGTLKAVFKFDGPESEHCVYNELVAVRLGQTLHAPVTAGVLTVAGRGHAFASVEIGAPGMWMPDILEVQLDKVAERYPEAVGALVAFDILIGNNDRYRNIKVSVNPHVQLFSAFDHGSALYGAAESLDVSRSQLRWGHLLVKTHPFYGRVRKDALEVWVNKVIRTPADRIVDCCLIGWPVGLVRVEDQIALGEALNERRRTFRKIIRNNLDRIRPV